MKRRTPARTSIVPLVVLQAACAGVASVTPACGETERNAGGDSTVSTTGVGGNVVVLAVNGFGGNVIALAVSGFGGNVVALAVSGFGGVPGTATYGTVSSTGAATVIGTAVGTATTGVAFGGAGGTVIALAVAGFGGQLGAGGSAGSPGEGGHAGADERELDTPGTDTQGGG